MPESGPAGDAKKRNLGRGLAALLGGEAEDYAALDKMRTTKSVPVDSLRSGKFQPRRHFDADEMDALARSIRAKGILQPIVVRRRPDNLEGYEIVAGERRWRAAQMAKLHEVPVVVKELSDRDTLEIALVENLQRQDLSPLEEAEGFQRLMAEFSHTQEALALALGKSRSHVANTLRLLGLPEAVKSLLQTGALTAGHARALLTAEDPAALARQVIASGLSVRQTENLAQSQKPAAPPRPSRRAERDANIIALERRLAERLGLKVKLTFDGTGGRVTLRYTSLDQLDDLLDRIGR